MAINDLRRNPEFYIQPNECDLKIGQAVEWDGQEGICTGKITSITEPFPGCYVLWIDDIAEGFPVNSSIVRPLKSPRLCQYHAEEREAYGESGYVVVPNGDCEKCYELSGRDPYNRDMTEPYEP